MSIISRQSRNTVSLAVAASLLGAGFTPHALAQTADVLTEIQVTGTRIRTPGLESTVPITSIGAEELLMQGEVNIGDALNDLPALRSTFTLSNSGRFIGTSGLSLLDLRGLGTSRTLVMVNGRRHVTSIPGEYSVDVNTIPSDLIERVDVVTGGNSAVYGSDAVAGVVNFITKRDFEGVRIRAQGGRSDQHDAGSQFGSIVAGLNTKDNRGNVAVALEYSKQDALYFTERDALTGAFSGRNQFQTVEPIAGEPPAGDGIFDAAFYTGVRSGSTSDGGMLTSVCNAANANNPVRCRDSLSGLSQRYMFQPDGTLQRSTPSIDFRDTTGGLSAASSNNIGGFGSTLRNTGQLRPSLARYSANVLAHYDFNDAFKPFIEAKGVHIESTQEDQPSFWSGSLGAFFGSSYELRCNNPYLGAQALATLQSIGRCATPATSTFSMARFNVDFGGRGEMHDRDLFRVVGGAEGTFNDDWHYEVSVNYGHLSTRMRSLNNLKLFDLNGNEDGFLLAINAVRNTAGQIVCAVNADADATNDSPNCAPINVFGVGAPSKEALGFINTTARRHESAQQFVASAFMSGDSSQWFSLQGGPMAFALGSEYRTEKASSAYDELTASGGTFLNAIQPFLPPTLEVKDVFAELRFPVLKDLPLIKEFTIEAAGRSSKYNNATGSVFAYNMGATWSPVSDIRFRGNYSKSIRAPTQGDLYSTPSQSFALLGDPCDVLYITNNPNRAANCAAAGIPVGFINQPAREESTSFSEGGNPTLKEETGRSLTVGAIYTPDFLPGFSVAVDYYRIDVKNLIASLSAQTILNSCYNSTTGIGSSYCSTVNRNADYTFADPAVIAGGINYASQEAAGVDFDVAYRTRLDNGDSLMARLIATKVIKVNNYIDPADPTYADRQKSELGDPSVSANLNVAYSHGQYDFNYSLRYIGKQTIGAYETQNSFAGRAPTNADAYPRVWYPSVVYHGVKGLYNFSDSYSAYVGIDNLQDKRPPLGLLGTGGGDPFDSIGRYFYVGVSAKY